MRTLITIGKLWRAWWLTMAKITVVLFIWASGCVTDKQESFSWSMGDGEGGQSTVMSRIKKLKSQIETMPNRADLRAKLADYYFLANDDELDGHYDLAIKAINEAIVLEPKNAMYHYRLGSYHQELNQLEEAEAAFRQSIKYTSEGYSGPDLSLAFVLALQNKNHEAINIYLEVLALYPNQPTALYYLASNYDCVGQTDLAEKYFEACARMDSPHRQSAMDQLMRLRRVKQKRSTVQKHLESTRDS